MKLNKDKDGGYNYMTPEGRVISNSYTQGLGDSLGRTAIAAEIYDEDREQLLKGIQSYFRTYYSYDDIDKCLYGYTMYATRYGMEEGDFAKGTSRDHILKAIAICHRYGEHDFVKYFLKYRAKRPGRDMPYTIDQKVWFKALYNKVWSWVYLIMMIPWLIFTYLWNKFIFFIGGYTFHDSPSVLINEEHKHRSKWQRLLDKVIVPAYGFFYTTYMVRELPVKFVRRTLQKLLRIQFEKGNHFARWLCGVKVSAFHYNPTRKNRWSVFLNESCDRDMSVYLNDTVENNVELGAFMCAKNEYNEAKM